MSEEKIKENRLRRQLDRMGYRLTKSRVRDDRALAYGGYIIADKWNNYVVAGAHPYTYSMSLDDVETFRNEASPCAPKSKKSAKKQ